MAISTERALEMAVKQARSVIGIIKAYDEHKHRISKEERRLLFELVGVIAQTKDLVINTVHQIEDHRWEE